MLKWVLWARWMVLCGVVLVHEQGLAAAGCVRETSQVVGAFQHEMNHTEVLETESFYDVVQIHQAALDSELNNDITLLAASGGFLWVSPVELLPGNPPYIVEKSWTVTPIVMPTCMTAPMILAFSVKDTVGVAQGDLVLMERALLPIDPANQPTQVPLSSPDGRHNVVVTLSPGALPTTDTDGDHLLDCEETLGVDVDCDGSIVEGTDLMLHIPGQEHPVAADPLVKDLFVEMDWADCLETGLGPDGQLRDVCQLIHPDTGLADTRSFRPPQGVVDLMEQAFADHGIHLHMMYGESYPATVGPVYSAAASVELQDAYNTSYSYNGEQKQEAVAFYEYYHGNSTDSPEMKAAKGRLYRYMFWQHVSTNNMWGNSFFLPNKFTMIAADVSSTTVFGRVLTTQEAEEGWAQLAMHEFGHALGLRHGGGDEWTHKPNHLSVMSYIYDGGLRDPVTNARVLTYSNFDGTLDQCALTEGVSFVDPLANNMRWNCGMHGTAVSDVKGPGWYDFDCDGAVTTGTLPGLNFVREACAHAAPGTPLEADLTGTDDIAWLGHIASRTAGADVVSLPPTGSDDYVTGAPAIILPGANEVLETIPDAADVALGQVVLPGANRICDVVLGVGDQPRRETGTAIECKLYTYNEWNMIDYVGAVPVQGPTGWNLEELEEPAPEEQARRGKQLALADLSVEGFSADQGSGTSEVGFVVTNAGPDEAQEISLMVHLPEDVALLSCAGTQNARCIQSTEGVAVLLDQLATGQSIDVTLQLGTVCDLSSGTVLSIDAQVFSVSGDPDVQNNSSTLTLEQTTFLDMEDPARRWVKSYTTPAQLMPLSNVSLNGDYALTLACGYSQFESPKFDTAELRVTGHAVEASVFLPAGNWPSSRGQIELLVDLPAANIWNRWISSASLNGRPLGQWSTLSFQLPADVRAALAGNFPDVRLRFQANISYCGGSVLFDQVQMGGTLECREDPPDEPVLMSSSILSFDNLADWSSSDTQLTLTSNHTEGAHGLALEVGAYALLKSRMFAAAELDGVTDELAFDVWLPDNLTESDWLGGMSVYLSCPSAGLWRRWLGYRALQILFDGEFNRLEYTLPGDVVGALQGAAVDCTFEVEVVANPVLGPMVVDNGGFF